MWVVHVKVAELPVFICVLFMNHSESSFLLSLTGPSVKMKESALANHLKPFQRKQAYYFLFFPFPPSVNTTRVIQPHISSRKLFVFALLNIWYVEGLSLERFRKL